MTSMEDTPSLMSMCLKIIEKALLHGYDQLHNILDLPSHLLDCLSRHLSPLGLEKLNELFVGDSEICKGVFLNKPIERRKRKRCFDLNDAWKILFKLRWATHVIWDLEDLTEDGGETCRQIINWHELYWEKHLQECLDVASEAALLPSFKGCISGLSISSDIINSIGFSKNMGLSSTDGLRLAYHCQKFGCYARHLRIQNVLCVAEACELLRSSQLQYVIFCNIKTEIHVEGVSNLVQQNRDTLLSLKFLHCKFSPNALNKIFDSVVPNGNHVIQHLSFESSSFCGNSLGPSSFLSFLSLARSLHTLKFSEVEITSTFARMIFDSLLESPSMLHAFEISGCDIGGSLFKAKMGRRSIDGATPCCDALKSLCVLNLRNSNLNMDDAEDLKDAFGHMPHLSSLDLSDNPLTDEGIRILLPYFVMVFEKSCPLSSIKLENSNLSSSGVSALLTTLSKSNQPLNCLSIAENFLDRCIAKPLADFLRTSRVRELNIEDIGLGPSGFQELQEKLPINTELSYLNISKNRGGLRAAEFVSKVILQFSELMVVDVSHNFLPLESLKVICSALQQAKGKLKKLNLTGNAQLCQDTAKLSELDVFRFHGNSIVVLPSSPSSVTLYDNDP